MTKASDEPRCSYCGAPGEYPPCCAKHRGPTMCETCRAVPGSATHRNPGKAST